MYKDIGEQKFSHNQRRQASTNVFWKIYNGAFGRSVFPGNNNGYVTVSQAGFTPQQGELALISILNSTGDLQLQKFLNLVNWQSVGVTGNILGTCQSADGSLISAFPTQALPFPLMQNAQPQGYFILKVNSALDQVLWVTTFPSFGINSESVFPRRLACTPDGGAVFTFAQEYTTDVHLSLGLLLNLVVMELCSGLVVFQGELLLVR